MSNKSIEDVDYELIKSYILHPEDSVLHPSKQEKLDRMISASKILEKNPVSRNAVALLQRLYPDISLSTAYRDLRIAMRLFNSLQTFNYEFWQNWLLNSIVKNIQHFEKDRDAASGKIIAMEHANLLKAIGHKPDEEPDPQRNEKHQFYILIQNDNRETRIDINKLRGLPEGVLHELTKAIYAGEDVTDATAEEIMQT